MTSNAWLGCKQREIDAAYERLREQLSKQMFPIAAGRVYTPPPWHKRLRSRLRNYADRLATAWRVLRGDDIHKDCDY